MPETPEFERIEDKREAEEAAHAEKPYRDAAAEYGEKLSPEAKQALDWIASQEGEKAIESYRSSRASERESAERILKEKALGSISVDELRLKDAINSTYRGFEDEKSIESIIEGVKKSLPKVISPEIDRILSSSSSIGEKQARLKHLASELSDAINESPSSKRAYVSLELDPYFVKGFFTKNLLINGEIVTSLERIFSERGTEKADEIIKRKKDFLKEHLELIQDVRGGEIAGGVSEVMKKQRNSDIDSSMEYYGYVWDSSRKRFLG